MPPSVPQRSSTYALDQACTDADAMVTRIARFVLHASALAERMDGMPVTDLRAAHLRAERVLALQVAAGAGRRAISRIGLADVPAQVLPADVAARPA